MLQIKVIFWVNKYKKKSYYLSDYQLFYWLDFGNIQMDTSKSNNLVSNTSNGNIIYVYGIGQANESDLYSLFTNCGRILRVNVIKNPKTGQSKGYGFVVFETYEEAYFAVHNMNGFIFNQRPLQVLFK